MIYYMDLFGKQVPVTQPQALRIAKQLYKGCPAIKHDKKVAYINSRFKNFCVTEEELTK